MPTKIRFRHPLRTAAELRLYLKLAFGVTIPDPPHCCPGHTSPWQIFTECFFARHRVAVIHASRGLAGKSYLQAALSLVEGVSLGCDVTILGGSGQQSQRVHTYLTQFWDHPTAPRHQLRSDPLKMETILRRGNRVQALLGSQSSVRGPHPQRLRLDEVDEMDLDIFTAALGQPMSQPGRPAQTLIASTHHHPVGTMTEVFKMAAEKRWPVYSYCYKETLASVPGGWLDATEVEAKRTDVPAVMWRTEYELESPSGEGLAIMPSAVQQMFRPELGQFEGADSEYIEVEPPQPGAQYRTGADWAKARDWTVIVTIRIDTLPGRMVAFERTGRKPWPLMIARFEWQIRRYGSEGVYDGTGLGSVIADDLTVQAEAVILVGRTRSNLLSEYISHVEHGSLISPYIVYMAQEHQHARVQDVFGPGHLPDSICAGALAMKDLEVIPDVIAQEGAYGRVS